MSQVSSQISSVKGAGIIILSAQPGHFSVCLARVMLPIPFMKNHPAQFSTLAITALCLAMAGCSLFHHHEPKSSFKIIQEGDRNPSIKYTPETITDTSTRKVEVERGPVGTQ